MKPLTLILSVSLGVFASCKKEEPAPAQASAPPPSSATSLPTLASPPPTAAPAAPGAPQAAAAVPAKTTTKPGQLAEDGTDVGLNKLTQAVQEYHENQERLPASLEELVTKGYLRQLPQPPAGKRYHLDAKTGHVTIVNR